MISRNNNNVPIFTKQIIAYLAQFLPVNTLVHLGMTCKVAYRHVGSFFDSLLKSPLQTLLLMARFDAKRISIFLDKFFWDNAAREARLLHKIDKDINNHAAHAMYALFAPRDHVMLNVIAIQQSITYLLANGFQTHTALIESLRFLVRISSEKVNPGIFPKGDENIHINLRGANLDNLDLAHICFTYGNLSDTSCINTKFYDAKFARANLRRAKLDYANFDAAQMWAANLSHASARHADFTRTNLSATDLRYADFTRAKIHTRREFFNPFLEQDNNSQRKKHSMTTLHGAHYNSSTIFPKPFSKRRRNMKKIDDRGYSYQQS